MVPKAEGLSIWGRGGGWMGDSSGERLSSPLASQGGGWRRRRCFLSSRICLLSLIVSCNLGKSLGESLRKSLGKSLRWVLLTVHCWMVDSRGRGNDSGGSLRLPRSNHRVCYSKGLEAVGRFPAARPLWRVGSPALGFLRLVFTMMIIKEFVRQMWLMMMPIETEHI